MWWALNGKNAKKKKRQKWLFNFPWEVWIILALFWENRTLSFKNIVLRFTFNNNKKVIFHLFEWKVWTIPCVTMIV